MNGNFQILFETTVKDIQNKIKENGHILPMSVCFKICPEEDGWIEPGMKAYIVDMVDFGDGFSSKVYLYFGEHEDYNKKFFKRNFSNYGREEILITALEKGIYNPHTHVILPKEDKFSKYFKLD